ncbi:MAG: flagellar biosynthetic protein FliO [Betaproteobacteria bacterium]|jgi:flagellar protein FliO/FliZ|nr:flagellar biosynthetic protein FliO [Betaproteobacteria bacterium]
MRNFFLSLFAALPGAALAQPAALPDAGASLLQVVIGLGVVLAALVGGLRLLKRLSIAHGATAGGLRVVAGASVGPRERVVLVEVEDTWLVVGVAPGQVNALHQMPKGKLAAAPPAQAGNDFRAKLKQILERKHAD